MRRSVVTHSRARYPRTEPADPFIRRTVVQLFCCAALLLLCALVRVVDHPVTQAVRSYLNQTLNVSTSWEDMTVFFTDMGREYGEFADQAVATFFSAPQPEETADSDVSAQQDGSEPLADQSGQSSDDAQAKDSAQVNGEADAETSAGAEEPAVTEAAPTEQYGETLQQEAQYYDSASTYAAVPTLFSDDDLTPTTETDYADYHTGQSRGELPSDITMGKLALDVDFVSPLDGTITSDFGYREHPTTGKSTFHYGVDIAAPAGTAIVAPASGTVIETGCSNAYGNYLVIDHGDAQTFYGHCSKLLVKKGAKVKQGQTIAKVGSTGISTGNHLHFEIRSGSRVVNPRFYIAWENAA